MDRSKLTDELGRDEAQRLKPYWDCGHSPAIVCPQCVAINAASVSGNLRRVGLLTIGIGRNLTDKGISRDEMFELCGNDIDDVTTDLDRAVMGWRNLDEVRQRVVANMCFNMGLDRLLKFRHFFAALFSGQYVLAAAEMRNTPWYQQVGPRAKRLEQAILTGVMP